MEATNLELCAKYVELGFGVAIVPSAFDMEEITKRRIVFIPMNRLIKVNDFFSLVMRKDKQLQPYMRAFIDYLLEAR